MKARFASAVFWLAGGAAIYALTLWFEHLGIYG